MRWRVALLFLGLMLTPLLQSGNAPPPKRKAKPAGTSKRLGKSTAGNRRTTKRGRQARRVVPKPAPSYQLHPDPERYVEIQKALADRGYYKGQINGEWGDDSVDSLKRFQADQKLPDDGKLSSLTLQGLGLGARHDGTSGQNPARPLPAPDMPPAPTPEPSQPPASTPPN